MKIKPLEWDDDLGDEEITAFPIFGRYWLRKADGLWELRLNYASGADMFQTMLGTFFSLRLGKAAAQKDYESKMMAAIKGVAP
jgi:hypothetical protein